MLLLSVSIVFCYIFIQVIDDITDNILGSIEVPIANLLELPEHTLLSTYTLGKCNSGDAEITLQLSLKVLNFVGIKCKQQTVFE